MRANPRYQITKLYDANGNVSSNFLDDEFYTYSSSWDEAMSHPGFAEIIKRDLEAEKTADDPLEFLAKLAPNDRVRSRYLAWLNVIDSVLNPWTTGGAIHFRPHWARVLMLALVMGDAAGLSDVDLDALSAAAVFHDSRRKNPYLDTGHGARAAHYYADACAQNILTFDPRVYLAMQWHDRDDEDGLKAIKRAVTRDDVAEGAMQEKGIEPETAGTGIHGASLPGAGMREVGMHSDNARVSGNGDFAASSNAGGLSSEDSKLHLLTPNGFAAATPNNADADATTLYRMFKDADGLDRIRLGDGGLDTRFLRFQYAHDALPFARELLAKCSK